MLQRIQTIYLFLAFISLVLLGIFPVVQMEKYTSVSSGKMDREKIVVSGFEDSQTSDSDFSPLSGNNNTLIKVSQSNHILYLNLAIWILSTISVLASISLFKNRILQIQFCWASMALILVLSVLIYLHLNEFKDVLPSRTLGIGAYSLSASLLLILLARKQILKDENLVRSVDRLR